MSEKPILPGVYCAIVTPLSKGRIDFERFQMHVRTLAADGCDGLLVSGTTGEGQSFDLAERADLITAAREVGRRNENPRGHRLCQFAGNDPGDPPGL